MGIEVLIAAILGLGLGFTAALLWARSKADSANSEAAENRAKLEAGIQELERRTQEWATEKQRLEAQLTDLRTEQGRLIADASSSKASETAALDTAAQLRGELERANGAIESLRTSSEELKRQLASAEMRAGEAERSKAETLAEKQKHFDEQIEQMKAYISEADKALKTAFDDASNKALKDATNHFLELTKQRFDEDQQHASKRAETEKQEIERLLEPLKKELTDLEQLSQDIEKRRAEAEGHLKATIENLGAKSDALTNALKKPSVRGSWGEGQLLSILESSGWQQGVNFDVQDVTEEDGKALRTDVVIHLPRGRKIIIDSKAPLDQYMAAMESTDEAEREQHCKEHSKAVRGHVKALEKKEYWTRYPESPHYVILFLPYEAAYQIACEYDRSLLDDAHKSRIILANPMTLMNLIHLATFVLNEERMQQNAEEVRNVGRQLCDRLGKVLEKISSHGRHIRIAAESYNDIVASASGRLLPAANRMRELGAGSSAAIAAPETVDTAIRPLVVPEAPTQPSLPNDAE